MDGVRKGQQQEDHGGESENCRGFSRPASSLNNPRADTKTERTDAQSQLWNNKQNQSEKRYLAQNDEGNKQRKIEYLVYGRIERFSPSRNFPASSCHHAIEDISETGKQKQAE